ncbi:MAG: MFS transporter [Nitrospira sp.]|nr:MFS transporter [Nitrospira sp.]
MTTSISKTKRWSLLVTVAAGLLLITLDNSVLYTALPTLTHELHASATQSLWIINAYPLVMAGLLLGMGTLGDRIGHRRMFLVGLVLFGIASLAAAFSPTAAALIAARAFLAVGAAAMMPATLALIRVTFEDERERNVAIAVWGSLSVVGAAIGPIVGGVLLSHFWWGAVFLINVPVVILAFVGTLAFAPQGTTDRERPWDLLSSLQALVALSALVVAIKELAHAGPSLPLAGSTLALALVAGVLFVRRQAHLPYPLLDFSIFRNPAFKAGVLAAAFAMFTIGGMQLVTTQRFQLVAGFSPLHAGLLVSAVAAGSLPTALLGGLFLHKLGLRVLIAGGLAVAALGAILAPIALQHGVGWLVATMVLNGSGLGAVMAVASSAIVGNVPPERAGMASSVEEVSYEFGSLIAVALLGSLLTALYSIGVHLPAGTPDAARESVAQALDIAKQGGEVNAALIDAASSAYDRSYRFVLWVIAGVLAIGAMVTAVLLRRYGPGSAATMHTGH